MGFVRAEDAMYFLDWLTQIGHNYGIVVNKESQRFYDEGKRHLFATFEMIALECWRDQNMSCFFVTDDFIWQKFKGSWVYDTTDQVRTATTTFQQVLTKVKAPREGGYDRGAGREAWSRPRGVEEDCRRIQRCRERQRL